MMAKKSNEFGLPWKDNEFSSTIFCSNRNHIVIYPVQGNLAEQNRIKKLIMAAPELLKACEYVMTGGYGCSPSVEFMDELKKKCEEAIIKATE